MDRGVEVEVVVLVSVVIRGSLNRGSEGVARWVVRLVVR